MATELYGVRVEEIQGEDLLLRVFLLYEDGERYIPESKLFFLCLLIDSLHPFNATQPLFGEIVDLDWWTKYQKRGTRSANYDKLFREQLTLFESDENAEKYIAELQVLEYHQPASKNDQEITFYYYNREKDCFGENETDIEQCVFYLRASDPRWFSHLTQNQMFSSACYEC